ncbi:MAG: acetyl-CoA carboxylase biotin carboxyl carrier protein [Pseudomonadota bacterium]
MDIRKVKKLIELLEESGIAEIEIHEGEESVRISRGTSAIPAATTVVQAAPLPAASPAPAASGEVFKSHMNNDDQAAKDDYTDSGHVITSPMVGVFYSSPSPEDPPFAARGQDVKAGDVLCIIEAMKIMNQIESDVSGKLVKMLAENGDAVEYGQPLFVIEEAES